jgi:hypothetical protein
MGLVRGIQLHLHTPAETEDGITPECGKTCNAVRLYFRWYSRKKLYFKAVSDPGHGLLREHVV